MNAEIIKSADYHKETREVTDILRTSGDQLDAETKRELEIRKTRGEVHRKVESITGSTEDIFVNKDKSNANVAGFYNGKSHVSEKTLDDLGWAVHVKRHEDLHGRSLSNIEMAKYMSGEHAESLVKKLKLQRLDDINWIEGFTELANITENKKHLKCAYLKREVPAAEKLEKLCFEHTGESLVDAFKTGNAGLFYYRLKKLADCLLLQDEAENMDKKMSGKLDIRGALKDRLMVAHIFVENKKDARDMIGKIVKEEIAKEEIYTKLAA